MLTINHTIEYYAPQHIFVGFSGGIDSTALLLLANDYAVTRNIPLTAIHFQHNLRGQESIADEKWCIEFCKKQNITLDVISLSITETSNIEAVARKQRLHHWKQLINKQDVPSIVLLGHHKDDRLENFFIRFLRGSSSTGLSSLRECETIQNVTFIRPLLSFKKDDLNNFLTERHITVCCHDTSNDEKKYTRNFLRHDIIPQLKRLSYAQKGMFQSLHCIEDDAIFLEQHALECYNNLPNKASIPLTYWRTQPAAMQTRILNIWINEFFDTYTPLNRHFFERFKEELNNQNPNIKIPIFEIGYIVFKNGISCLKKREKNIENKTIELNILGNNKQHWGEWEFEVNHLSGRPCNFDKNSAFFDYEVVKDKKITVRHWLQGDSLIPFNKHTPVKLKKLFINAKYSLQQKQSHPVVLAAETIIWLPLIKHTSFAPITKKTKQVVEIKIKKIKSC